MVRYLDSEVETVDDERQGFEPTSGELEALSKVCVWRGDWEREFDLRKFFRAEDFLRPVDGGRHRKTGCDFV
jgi:hypothetical protein